MRAALERGFNPGIELHECPDGFRWLWEDFLDLHQRRGQGFAGEQPISYEQLALWGAVTGRLVFRWQVRAILGLDDAYFEHKRETAEAQRAKVKPSDG